MAEPPVRVLVVKLSAMGDVIHALPAVHRLRTLLPESEIHWLVSERWSPLLQGVSCVDGVLTTRRGLSGSLSLLKVLRAREYGMAIDLQGLLKSALITMGSGAPLRVGFSPTFAREPVASIFYNYNVSPAGTHVVDQLVEMVERGVERLNPHSSPPLPDEDRVTFGLVPTTQETRWAEECLGELGLSPPFAVLLPGTGWETKTWEPEKFSILARELKRRHSIPSLVVWGPGEEGLIPAEPGVFVAPPTDIRQMMALLSLAKVAIGGDTGPLHMSVALGVPVVGLYGPTLPERNGPYCGKNAVVCVDCPERGGHKRVCTRPCVASLGVEQVLHAVGKVLKPT